jgi:hypothetical protein
MIVKHRKRPRDPIHLGKLVGDILTGQVENRAPASPKDEGNVPSPKIYYLHPLMIGPSCASPRTRPRRSLRSAT